MEGNGKQEVMIGSERGLPGLSVCLVAGSRIKNGGREWLFEERARGTVVMV